MKNSRTVSCSATWHTSGEKSQESYAGWSDVPKTPAPIPEDLGDGFFEALIPKKGIVAIRGSHRFLPEHSGKLIALVETDLSLHEPAIIIQSAATGRARVKDNVLEQEYDLGEDKTIFQHLDHINFARAHETSQTNDLYYFVITQSAFRELLGESNAEALLAAQNVSHARSTQTLNLPRNMQTILHFSMNNNLIGDFRKLYAQGAVLEYLSLLSNHVLSDQQYASCPRKTKLVRQLHEELMNLKGDIPNLSEISERYELSTRTLNSEFKKEYGQSIYAYVKEQRLNEAHAELLESDTPIKVIAAKMGYAHVANFMLAFKKKFGYPPGSLRR